MTSRAPSEQPISAKSFDTSSKSESSKSEEGKQEDGKWQKEAEAEDIQNYFSPQDQLQKPVTEPTTRQTRYQTASHHSNPMIGSFKSAQTVSFKSEGMSSFKSVGSFLDSDYQESDLGPDIPEMNKPGVEDPDADWFSQAPTLKKKRSHKVRKLNRRMSYLE